MNMDLSVAICTFNRHEILSIVLEHFFLKVKLAKSVEIIIIDNNSTDKTRVIIGQLQAQFSNLKYVLESKQGLSNARNRAIEEATKSYIMFLDDDGLADESLLVKTEQILRRNPEITVLGGVYQPWYYYGKPYWFKDHYASKNFRHERLHVLDKSEYLSGGIMLFHKDIFKQVGHFLPDLGMNKDVIFYGEETEFQNRIREAEIVIYGDNELYIKHVVQKYKLNLKWFFKQKIAAGKTLYYTNPSKNSIIFVFKALMVLIGQLIIFPIKNLPKLIARNYYIQNYLIDSFTKPVKWFVYLVYLVSAKKVYKKISKPTTND